MRAMLLLGGAIFALSIGPVAAIAADDAPAASANQTAHDAAKTAKKLDKRARHSAARARRAAKRAIDKSAEAQRAAVDAHGQEQASGGAAAASSDYPVCTSRDQDHCTVAPGRHGRHHMIRHRRG